MVFAVKSVFDGGGAGAMFGALGGPFDDEWKVGARPADAPAFAGALEKAGFEEEGQVVDDEGFVVLETVSVDDAEDAEWRIAFVHIKVPSFPENSWRQQRLRPGLVYYIMKLQKML